MSVVFTGATLLRADGSAARGHVLVEGGRIAAILDAGEAPPAAAESFDARGHLLTPGLVDAHTHLYQSVARDRFDGLALDAWLEEIWAWAPSPEELYDSCLLGAAEAIRTGTTCVSDMLAGPPVSSDSQVEGIHASGLRATVALMLDDFVEGENQVVLSTEQVIELSREFVERWQGESDRLRVRLGPAGLPACSEEFMRWCREYADERGVGIHTHCAEGEQQTEGSRERLGHGEVAALAEWGVLAADVSLAHTIWVDDGEIELLATRGGSPVHCPTSNVRLADGIARVPEMLERGIPVAIACDGAASGSTYDLLTEGRIAGLLQKARLYDAATLGPADVFRAITAHGATAAGWGDEVGSLEAGLAADLALWDLTKAHTLPGADPLARFVNGLGGHDCTDLMVSGEWVMRERRILSFDEPALLERVAARTGAGS